MGMGPWLQALLGASPKRPVQRGDVLAVLMANAALIGFNIALTDMLVNKVTALHPTQPTPVAQVTTCPAVAPQGGAFNLRDRVTPPS